MGRNPVGVEHRRDDRTNLRSGDLKSLIGLDDEVGQTAFVGVWHLPLQNGFEPFAGHAGTGEHPPFLRVGVGGHHNHGVERSLATTLEQQGDIQHGQFHAAFTRLGQFASSARHDQRVDDALQPLERGIVPPQRFRQKSPASAVRATEALLNCLRQLKTEGVSSILVTHNLHHAYQVCDRHIVMNHGRKILDVRKEDTSVEELTAAVVEGAEGVRRFREGASLTQVV